MLSCVRKDLSSVLPEIEPQCCYRGRCYCSGTPALLGVPLAKLHAVINLFRGGEGGTQRSGNHIYKSNERIVYNAAIAVYVG